MKDIREGDQMRETKNNGHVGGGEKNRKMSVTLQTQIRRCKRIFCARQFVSITSLLMINYNKSNGQRAILEIIHFYSWRGRTKPNLCTLKPNASLCRNVCSGWVFSISLSLSRHDHAWTLLFSEAPYDRGPEVFRRCRLHAPVSPKSLDKVVILFSNLWGLVSSSTPLWQHSAS